MLSYLYLLYSATDYAYVHASRLRMLIKHGVKSKITKSARSTRAWARYDDLDSGHSYKDSKNVYCIFTWSCSAGAKREGGAKYRISSIRRRHRILSGALSETPLSNSSRTKTSGVPAQPLVMQSNSQFLHWTLSPPKQGFPPLANFKLHVFSNSQPFFSIFGSFFVVHLLLCYTFTIAYISPYGLGLNINEVAALKQPRRLIEEILPVAIAPAAPVVPP